MKPKLIKDGRTYLVLYAEGTKGQEFTSKEDALRFMKLLRD